MTGPTQLVHRKTVLTTANHPSSPSYHTIPASTKIHRKSSPIYGAFLQNTTSMRHYSFVCEGDEHVTNLLKTPIPHHKPNIWPDFYTTMDEVANTSMNLSKPYNLTTNFRKSHTCGSLFVKCNCGAKDQLKPFKYSLVNETQNKRQQHIEPLAIVSNSFEENFSIIPNRKQISKQYGRQSPTQTESSIAMQNSFNHAYASSKLPTANSPHSSQTAIKSNREKSLENAPNTNDINGNSCGVGFSESPATARSTVHTNTLGKKQHSRISSPCLPADLNLAALENQHLFQRRTRKSESALNKSERKLFGTFLHPDTNFIFTDANRHPSGESLNHTNSENLHPSSPANGHKGSLNPSQEIPLNIIAQYSPDICKQLPRQRQRALSTQRRHHIRRLFSQTQDIESNGSTSESEKSLERSVSIANLNSTPNNLACTKEYRSEKSKAVTESSCRVIINDDQPFKRTTSLVSMNESSNNLQTSNPIQQTLNTSDTQTTSADIVQPLVYPALHIQIQPQTEAMQQTNLATECGFSPNLTTQSILAIDDKDAQIKSLQGEIVSLKDVIKFRDIEIAKLRREIHKLKSVLQQTTQHLTLDNDEANSPTTLTTPITPTTPTANTKAILVALKDVLCEKCLKQVNGCKAKEMLMLPSGICKDAAAGNSASSIDALIRTSKGGKNGSQGNLAINKNDPTGHQLLLKKQGVSAESCQSTKQENVRISIPKYEKDFASKQLIKEAIMDNDFLKNIDASQVRELVDSMYSLSIPKGKFVIREGEAGAHLYVSAKGEFEVERNGKILGVMGPGKAFGELAILYNCTRTASIRVLCDANVWVLDRRIFQQIMMRTGLQRIENSVNFLKSVPLLKNLNQEVLAKIADVLEVEFYPANTYIIRQGASGDTFFIISQGSVRVTQKLPYSNVEQPIRILGQGDYFGEKALINEDKRTANIIALEPGVECLTLNRESFTHLIGDLSELKEKSYGDENRILASTYLDKNLKNNPINIQQEFANLKLSDMEIVSTLGVGGFGRVELVKFHQNNTAHIYALKCLCKQHIVDTKQEEHVFSERTIMLACNSPFICRLYRTFRDDKYVYMLLEACMGGEIWTMLRDQGCFNESSTKFIVACVLQAFEYLHERGIIYRDLKPENLMLNENGYVKLVDFGFAKCVGKSSKTWTFCGTPEYVAPEIILNKGHDRAVDYWAIGILIHELLSGRPPFAASDPMKIYNLILKGIDMIDLPKQMSRSVIQLIKKLCRDVPVERLGYQRGGISDIMKHKWFLGFDWDGLKSQTLVAPFQRPITHSTDTCYFDKFSCDSNEPPTECSGWDVDF